MTAAYFLSTLAALLALSSVLLLRESWHRRRAGKPSPVLRLGAWGVFSGACVCWAAATTADWGIAVALCVFMVAGLGAIGWVAVKQPRRQTIEAGKFRMAQGQSPGPKWKLGGRRLYIFLLAGPVSGAAALALTVALYGLMGGADGRTAGQLFTALFCFPFFWSVLTLVATFDMPLSRRSMAVFAAAIVGFAATYSIT